MALLLVFLLAFFGAFLGDSDSDGSQRRDRRNRENPPGVVNPPPTAIPTPALLPGLVGFGLSVLRQRKRQDEAEGNEPESSTDSTL